MLTFPTSLALAAAPLAQEVLIVDDDGGADVDHTSIQAAIDAAPQGSVIDIRDGIYGPASIDGRSLVVTTESTGSVVVNGGLTIRNLGPTQSVTVRGVGIVESTGTAPPLVIEENEGVVWLENCLILLDHEDHEEGVYVRASSDVVMRVCTVVPQGGPSPEAAGIRARSSRLHLYDVNSVGSDNAFAIGSPGIVLIDSFLYAAECRFEGGDGGIACPSQCFPQPGGVGIRLAGPGGSTANLTNTDLAGGQGGQLNGVFAPEGAASQVLSGALAQEATLTRNVTIPSPVRTHETAQVTILGGAGDLVYALYSDTPGPIYLASFFDSLAVGAPSGSFFLATLDAHGTATVPLNPNLPPGVLARTIYTQMLHVDLTHPGSPQFDLGTPTSVVILDSSF